MSILFQGVSHIYGSPGMRQHQALDNINLEIPEGSFTALVGHTGSGKSTLVQVATGLLKPSAGTVLVDGEDTTDRSKEARAKRRRIGLVFQYPEHQLFEETIAKDVAFGPKNQGLSDSEVQERVIEAMAHVGLDYEQWKDRSPFDLSGGQKRRVALAGVLAMRPKYLICDEPVAGLDPLGRDRVLENLAYLHREVGVGIILVSHSMDDVARYAERLIVMDHGRIALDDRPVAVFRHAEELRAIGLDIPQMSVLMHRLKARGLDVDTDALTIAEAKASILEALGKGGERHAR